MRTASDSLYDDLQQFGTSRGTRSRFSNAVRRAGSLETCGFKQRFLVTFGAAAKSDPRSEVRNLPFSLLKEMGPPEAQRESVQRAAAAKSDPRP